MDRLTQGLTLVAGLGCAAALLVRHLWRCVLFLFPASVRVEPEAPADQMQLPAALAPQAGALEALGFRALGSHEEWPRLRAPQRAYSWAHARLPVFATLRLAGGATPRLDLLTPLSPDGFVLTAAYPRAALELPRHRSGGLADASAERVLRAHLRRLEGLTPAAAGDFCWEGRVEAARAWVRGPGGRCEVRREHVQGVVWTLAALLIAASALLVAGRR